MSITTPTREVFPRTTEQRMDALRRANHVRVQRALLKRDLKVGSAVVTIVLRFPGEYVETMKVLDLLMATPKFGRVKAAQTLNRCRISASKTVGGLSDRQRGELIALIEGRP